MLGQLAHVIHRRRWTVIGFWILLTAFGAFGAQKMSQRWFQQFSIPGYSAYETNQKVLHAFGSGEAPPIVLVFRSQGDVTQQRGIERAIDAAAAAVPRSRTSSYFSTGSKAYVSADRHTTFAELYPPGQAGFGAKDWVKPAREAVRAATPSGVTANATGIQALEDASSGGASNGPSIATEATIGGAGAIVILLFVFGTVPAIAM